MLTKKKGATLKRGGARLARVGIVATTCKKCGKADVFVGSTKIGRITLRRAGSTSHRQVLMLPAFSARSGKIKIKVVTRDQQVRIDGVVIGAG